MTRRWRVFVQRPGTFLTSASARPKDVGANCEVVGPVAAREGRPSDRARQDAGLAARVRAAYVESKGRFGSPRVHAVLRAQGLRHSASGSHG